MLRFYHIDGPRGGLGPDLDWQPKPEGRHVAVRKADNAPGEPITGRFSPSSSLDAVFNLI